MLSWVHRLLCPSSLGVRGLVSNLPLEQAVGPPPLSPRLLLLGSLDSSKTPLTAHTPPTTDHTYGAPKAKTPGMPSKPKTMFSPKASATLTKFKGMSNDDGPSRKRRGESASREVPSKNTKVDDNSDSYSSPTPSKSEPPKKERKKKKTKGKRRTPTRAVPPATKNGQPPRNPTRTTGRKQSPGRTMTAPASGKETSPTSKGTDSGRGSALKS